MNSQTPAALTRRSGRESSIVAENGKKGRGRETPARGRRQGLRSTLLARFLEKSHDLLLVGRRNPRQREVVLRMRKRRDAHQARRHARGRTRELERPLRAGRRFRK